MWDTIRASERGLKLVDGARRRKRWSKQSAAWCDTAHVTLATLKRFWRSIPIDAIAFEHICRAVGVPPEQVIATDADLATPIQTCSPLNDDLWVGRSQLISSLSQYLQEGRRLLLLVGMTGIGKTALAERVARTIGKSFTHVVRLNLDARADFAYSREAQSKGDFISVATWVLEQCGQRLITEDGKPLEPERVVSQWVSYLVHHDSLLIIDSLELILRGDEIQGWSNFVDPLWKQFFHRLLTVDTCQSRIIVTSQDLPAQMEAVALRYSHTWYCQCLKGLDPAEQLELFQAVGLEVDADPAVTQCLTRIGAVYEGHPLALRIIAGEMVHPPFNGNVLAYWNQYGSEIEAVETAREHEVVEADEDTWHLDRYTRQLRRVVNQRINLALRRLQTEVQPAYALLCWNATYRRAVPESFWLNGGKGVGLDDEIALVALDTLRDRYLVEETLDHNILHLRQHNLIRSIALEHLKVWRVEHPS